MRSCFQPVSTLLPRCVRHSRVCVRLVQCVAVFCSVLQRVEVCRGPKHQRSGRLGRRGCSGDLGMSVFPTFQIGVCEFQDLRGLRHDDMLLAVFHGKRTSRPA